MVQVQTVRGAVAADALGTVLIHEHVFVRSPDVLTNYPALWNEEERVADAVARLRALKERGVDTIADPTVLGLGRDIRRVARVNDQVDLNIVPATDVMGEKVGAIVVAADGGEVDVVALVEHCRTRLADFKVP
jgi:phosphotriesterase-related protein